MNAHLKCLRYVLRHKWFVFLAGLQLRVPLWQLIVHDWSKCTPSEWGAYVRFFYGFKDKLTCTCPEFGSLNAHTKACFAAQRRWKIERELPFNLAWLHHQKRNKHHWQYWVLMGDRPDEMRYAVQSPDCMTDYCIAEYDLEQRQNVSEVWLKQCSISDEGGGKRVAFAEKVVRDANRYRALPMPERYAREMVADWIGAGRAITGKLEVAEWYRNNSGNVVLHPETRRFVEHLIASFMLQGGL